MSRRKRTFGAILALVTFAASPVIAAEDSHFSVAVGTHGDLLILSPEGAQIAEVAKQTIGRSVSVGNTVFQVSYGCDATGQMTAVLTPPDANSVSLHFSAGGKSIDADKAVVTLTFAPNLSGVLVDPGYVGTVVVDSHLLRAHSLADDLPASTPDAQPTPPSDVVAPAPVADSASTAVVATSDQTPTPTPAQDPVALAPAAPASGSPSTAAGTTSIDAVAAAPVSTSAVPDSGKSSLPPSTPPLMASQLAPMISPVPQPPTGAAPVSHYQGIGDPMTTVATGSPATGAPALAAPDTVKTTKLYWSEPVTAPDGTAPQVALDEIRLVEVHGDVVVVAPGGSTQAGTEGMVVPSGSTVRTSDNSTAALFMGGVNSARLMPKCELTVTQNLAGFIRTNVINLQAGAVFSRVGHRDGETENYSVCTAEGRSDAGVADMLAYRGTPGGISTTDIAWALDPKRLLAWNPAPAHGLISDVPTINLGILTPIGNIPATYFYYASGGRLTFNAIQIRTEVLTNLVPNATTTSQSEPDYVLQSILTTLQPYNLKLNQLLKAINNGTETPAQLTYYHSLITVFFDQQAPGVVNTLLNRPHGFNRQLNIDSAMLWQDLREFKISPLTQH